MSKTNSGEPRHEHQTRPSNPEPIDLFAEQNTSLESPAKLEGEGTVKKELRSVPIEWFAKEQERLRKAGEDSARRYWAKKGIRWP